MSSIVTKSHIVCAFKELGAGPADMMLIHSSLKSFGQVEGGPMSVIDAAKETVTEQGTVVFPTLVQRDFQNAYRNWDVNRSPSDVGLITETFRLLPDSLRSDQATHSVAAWGSRAAELTAEHTAYGPRMGIYGDYCFSYSSPWQKMYFNKALIVFIGVDTMYNTFKHFAEYVLMEHYCTSLTNPAQRCMAMSAIARHNVPGVWPYHDVRRTQAALEELGLVARTTCGNAVMIGIRADRYVDSVLRLFKETPDAWFDADTAAWIRTCQQDELSNER
ncbi:AAC(3) family N-acetyltransferase [Paenibacillus hodogayensis]|uniref:Aminoglycoside N(3)-acetyltransferase n=1 Tax=Paenibacillus hodogayensis TaxID=279208 RepID=A0ABV5VWN7_9BACL